MAREEKMKFVLKEYEKALEMLDGYDHQNIKIPNDLNFLSYFLEYDEAKTLINMMKFFGDSDIFGKEKKEGELQNILNNIYQSAFGEQIYKSTEEKAAHLLYYIIKNHPFVDGCKRISLALFIYFLHQNNLLFKDGKKIIEANTLVALILLIAHSKSEEKEIMINLIINFLRI